MLPLKRIFYELSGRYLCLLAIFYILGLISGKLWLQNQADIFYLAGLTLALLVTACYFRMVSVYKAVLLLLVVISGGTAFYYAVQAPAGGILAYRGETVYVEGTVIEEPVFYEDRDVYHLQVEVVESDSKKYAVSGKLLVNIYGSCEERGKFWFGDSLRIRGTINEPRGLRNPGGFDYRFYLRSRGIDAVMNLQPAQVSMQGKGTVNLIATSAVSLRSDMAKLIKHELSYPAGEILTAMLFGQRHHLPEEIEYNFRRAGAAHLMAVSGLHVGLVAALVLGLGRILGLRGRLPVIMAIITVLAYAYLTGLRPPALRAAIMINITLGAFLLDRERDLPTAIAAAALLTLFINPLLLFSIGFQLSYAATLILVYAYRPLEHLLAQIKCPAFLRSPVAITLAAQLGVLPLCVYYFHHLTAGALFFNLLLLPLIAFVVGLGLFGALLALLFQPAGAYLLWAAYPLLELMILVTGLSNLPGFYLPVNPPSLTFLIVFYSFLAAGLFIYYHWLDRNRDQVRVRFVEYLKMALFSFLPSTRFRFHFFAGIVLLPVVAAVWISILIPSEQNLKVTFIDVGQGAAALVETPCEAVIMVDAGGELPIHGEPGEIGERVILPFLRHRGVNELDLAVVSHSHEDHFGGFLSVIGEIPIKHMLISPVPGETVYYEELLEQADKKGIPVKKTYSGDVWRCGPDLSIKMLGPPEKLFSGTGSDLNNNSIVFLLSYREIRMLFTGDIEDAAAKDLLGRRVDLKADLLQVPHHGGYMEVMPEFLAAVKPEKAVIQVGPNHFGHPHPHVTDSLKEAGVVIFRTDQHGAVIVETCGLEIEIQITEQPALVN
ncbi:MAG: DNA internalization-related competence protein ComEC/Rec2 [Bacillota bacterium]